MTRDGIPLKETLEVEFKSDRKRLSDEQILETVVALANTDGGRLYLGVEDDGTPTGIHKSHCDITRLAAFIANSTVPPVSVRTKMLEQDDVQVIEIEVPRFTSVVATSSGKIMRRRTKSDGSPESVPMYPYEITTRLSDLGRLDYSAQPVPDTTIADFDPLEIARLRAYVQNSNKSDKTLLELDDEELLKALGLVISVADEQIPTVAGLLILGTPQALELNIPTHEAAFQVLDGTEIRRNDSYRLPLLNLIETISANFAAWNQESEFMLGMLSVRIPDFDSDAFREALVNAFGHRDYARLGRVRVALDEYGLTISNPGGLVEGITIDTLLKADPHGRNPQLMNALKRIGVAERTGRGVDRIFKGSLQYGRAAPDYSQTTSTSVTVFIAKEVPDKAFTRMVIDEQNKTGHPMSLDTLLVLNTVKQLHRPSLADVVRETHLPERRALSILEEQVEAGTLEATAGNRRSYTLSAKIYDIDDKAKEYVRLTDIEKVRYAELVLRLMDHQGKVRRSDVAELLHISDNQAYYLLRKMQKDGQIEKRGGGPTTYYVKA